jgi:uncharacterized protein YraI
MIPSHLIKGVGLGIVFAGLSAGVAMAAVATTDVNVRSGPGTGYPVVSGLSAGQYASIVRTSGGWCYVNKAGTDGWVSCAYLTGGSAHVYVQSPDYYEAPDYYNPPPVYFSYGFGGFPHHRMMHRMPRPGMYPWPWPPTGGMGPHPHPGPHP